MKRILLALALLVSCQSEEDRHRELTEKIHKMAVERNSIDIQCQEVAEILQSNVFEIRLMKIHDIGRVYNEFYCIIPYPSHSIIEQMFDKNDLFKIMLFHQNLKELKK